MKKFLLIVRFFFIIFFVIFYHTSVYSISAVGKFTGQGELKIPKNTFDIIEFYLSAGKYGEIYNNPKYDWQKKMIKKFDWRGSFIILSQNGKGVFWYYGHTSASLDTSTNYLGKARDKCTKQGYGECFIFAVKNKIVWQNGINPKKGTKIKKKEVRNGELSAKLKELGFYDGDNTQKKEIEKKETTQSSGGDITKQLRDLIEMYESGLITEDDFKKAKKKLLD